MTLQNIRKIPGVAHPKPWETLITFCKLWAYPRLAVSVCGYIFLHYWWYVHLPRPLTHKVDTKYSKDCRFAHNDPGCVL